MICSQVKNYDISILQLAFIDLRRQIPQFCAILVLRGNIEINFLDFLRYLAHESGTYDSNYQSFLKEKKTFNYSLLTCH